MAWAMKLAALDLRAERRTGEHRLRHEEHANVASRSAAERDERLLLILFVPGIAETCGCSPLSIMPEPP